MPMSIRDIRLMESTRYATPSKLIYEQPAPIPTGAVVTGQQGLLRVQWTPNAGVDGYDVAIMTSPNLAGPDINIVRVMGPKSREFAYPSGNSAITRYFAVRSFVGGSYSSWCPIVSATSVVFGAPEAAPPSPPVNPPSGDEPLPAGRNFGNKFEPQ